MLMISNFIFLMFLILVAHAQCADTHFTTQLLKNVKIAALYYDENQKKHV